MGLIQVKFALLLLNFWDDETSNYQKQKFIPMKRSFLFAFFAFVSVTLLFSLSDLQAQRRERWELLGSRKVDFRIDHDVIPVTWKEGAFDAIRIVVKDGALNMHRCVIHFENGDREEVAMRHQFRRGSGTRIIDLPGNKRLIEKIEFWYDTKNYSGQKATVMVFGRH